MQSGKTQILPQNKGAVLKAVVIVNRVVRLILTRIRLRASDFGQVAKINLVRAIETGFSYEIGCGDGARVICLFARVIQQLVFWAQKIQANVDLLIFGAAKRPFECTSPGPGLEHPSLRSDSSMAATRRAEALHVVLQSIRAQHESCCSVYSRMIRIATKDALGALPSLFSRSEPASTNS